MPLYQRYNVVPDPVEVDLPEMSALQFFRTVAADESLPARVTVRGLERLLLHLDSEERTAALADLQQVLHRSDSFEPHSVVQFVVDAGLVHDDRFRLRLEHGGEPVYLPIGELFIAEPQLMSADQFVARK
jgi:hypothetical protein